MCIAATPRVDTTWCAFWSRDRNAESVHIADATCVPAELLAKSIASLQGQEYFRSGLERAFELSLTPIYTERGFLKSKIIAVKAALSPNGGVALEVPISEGEQYA